jgi:hypothetical protein
LLRGRHSRSCDLPVEFVARGEEVGGGEALGEPGVGRGERGVGDGNLGRRSIGSTPTWPVCTGQPIVISWYTTPSSRS